MKIKLSILFVIVLTTLLVLIGGIFSKERQPDGPMEEDTSAPCDFDSDGDCDEADFQFFRGTLETCRGEVGYHPAPDANGDGCVTLSDQSLLFPVTPEK